MSPVVSVNNFFRLEPVKEEGEHGFSSLLAYLDIRKHFCLMINSSKAMIDSFEESFSVPAIEASEWNVKSISRFALKILGSTAIGVGSAAGIAALFGAVSIPVGMAGITAIALGSLAVWGAGLIYDYENPNELAFFQREAEQMHLLDVIEKHGLESILKYQILSPEKLNNRVIQYNHTHSINEIIDLYLNIRRALHSLSIEQNELYRDLPRPTDWKQQFFDEISLMGIDEFSQSFDLFKLRQVELITLQMNRDLTQFIAEFQYIQEDFLEFQNYIQQLHLAQTESAKKIKDAEIKQIDKEPFLEQEKAVLKEAALKKYEKKIAYLQQERFLKLEEAEERYRIQLQGLDRCFHEYLRENKH